MCKYWDQRFPQNKSLGICTRMGVSEWTERMHVSVTTNDENFGCVLHSDYVFTQLEGTI